MSSHDSKVSLFVAVGVLAVVLTSLIGLLTPWHVLPVGVHPSPPSSDFTSAQISKARSFHSALLPWAIGSWLLGLALVGLVGFTSLGAKILGRLPGPYFLSAFIGVLIIEIVINFAQTPVDMIQERTLRNYGLSTQSWRSWFVERMQHLAIGASLTALGLALLVICARIFGQRWWVAGGVGAMILVAVLSYGYPVIFEPIFNKFTPMAASPLRDELMTMAASDDVPVKKILVADASRRTTALNAYVSGFGATRRIVLYDVLLDKATPTEVKLVVAHELGHAKSNDVGRYTLVGAVSAGLGVALIALLLRWRPLLDRAGLKSIVNPLADPRSVALVLALVAFFTLVQQPVSALISRNIEARADVHALELTKDPADFVDMQRALSISNLSNLNPNKFIFWLFATHPTPTQRIGVARAWARLNHQVEPAPITSR